MRSCFLAVDKPAGITSHDVVAMLRAVTGAKKVGHTGTLDPFATGVLPLALGGATRLIPYLDEDLKVYDATISLGSATDTGDPTGQVVREAPVPEHSDESVREVLSRFRGVMMQAPPRYSAVKVRGKPLYAYAREGEDVVAAARPTRIDSIELVERDAFLLHWYAPSRRPLRLTTDADMPGMHTLVMTQDVDLGTAGHLSALRRTVTGRFTVDQALTLPQLGMIAGDSEDWSAVLRPARGPERVRWAPRDAVWEALAPRCVSPVDALSHLPSVPLRPGERQRALSGSVVPHPPADVKVGDSYLLVEDGDVLAIAIRDVHGPRISRLIAEEEGRRSR